MLNLTMYLDFLYLGRVIKLRSTLRSKGSKIEDYFVSSKIEFLGFYDMLNLTMYLDFGYWTIKGKCPI